MDVPRKPRDPRVVSIEFPHSRSLAPRTDRSLALRVLAAAALVVLVIVALLPQPPAPTQGTVPTPGMRAPDFTLPTDKDDSVSLSAFSGRAVVVHFINLICCSPSALEVGWMKEAEPEAGDAVFISIAICAPGAGTRGSTCFYSPERFRELFGFNWTIALDAGGGVQATYGAVETTTIVVDRQGVIRFRDDVPTSAETVSSWLGQVP